MKRILFTLLICALMAAPAMASPTLDGVSPHLGWWDPANPKATHQYWDFTVNVYKDGGPYDYFADPPTEMVNQPLFAKAWISGVYDGVDSFTADPIDGVIQVLLEIGNFPDPSAYKEIWVDIGYTGTLTDTTAKGTGGGLTYTWTPLTPFSDPCGVAELGFKIMPNPWKEDIFFTITAHNSNPPTLDWIHVDTICIPAPGAILLGSIGVGLVGWMRRKTLL